MRGSDVIQRFIFEHHPIRGQIVRLNATYQAVLKRHEYPEPIQVLLGEAMASAALLSATIKFDGSLILQAQGKGPINMLVVESTSKRHLRGLVHWSGDVEQDDKLDAMFGGGNLVITINPAGGKERYQGIVELGSQGIGDAVERYFTRSEQLPTQLRLAADGTEACGLLLQHMPGADTDSDSWNRITTLGATITTHELLSLPAQEIVHRLFHEEDLRIFTPEPTSFRCSCSVESIEAVLRMLGYDEVKAILREEGKISVNCEFCNQHYEFDEVDTERLFAASSTFHVPPTRH